MIEYLDMYQQEHESNTVAELDEASAQEHALGEAHLDLGAAIRAYEAGGFMAAARLLREARAAIEKMEAGE